MSSRSSLLYKDNGHNIDNNIVITSHMVIHVFNYTLWCQNVFKRDPLAKRASANIYARSFLRDLRDPSDVTARPCQDPWWTPGHVFSLLPVWSRWSLVDFAGWIHQRSVTGIYSSSFTVELRPFRCGNTWSSTQKNNIQPNSGTEKRTEWLLQQGRNPANHSSQCSSPVHGSRPSWKNQL